MFKTILADWLKQYLPILVNSLCAAICVAMAGCRLTAEQLSVAIDYPAYYHSPTNSLN